MLNIFLSFLIQIVGTIGVIYLGGFIISFINKKFYANLGNASTAVCYATGFLGTPVHEVSHALFCVIFRHKITEIKLFQIDPDSGTLGYVNHTYNPKNIYQRAGNFFIGVAPIIVMSALLYALSQLLMKDLINSIFAEISAANFGNGQFKIFNNFTNVGDTFAESIGGWQFWVFLIIGAIFALHMNLSSADIKGSVSGLLIVIAVFFIVDIVLGLVSSSILSKFTSYMIKISSCLILFLLISIIISSLLLLLTLFIKIAIKKLKRPGGIG